MLISHFAKRRMEEATDFDLRNEDLKQQIGGTDIGVNIFGNRYNKS